MCIRSYGPRHEPAEAKATSQDCQLLTVNRQLSFMTSIAIIGPKGSNTWQAAHSYAPEAEIKTYPNHAALEQGFAAGDTEMMILPVYNTRMGGVLRSFQILERMKDCFWCDNIVQPIHLSLAALDSSTPLTVMMGTGQVIRQSEEYLAHHYPDVSLLTVADLETAMADIKSNDRLDYGIIEAEGLLQTGGFTLREREVAPHNKTRYAVISKKSAPAASIC